MSRPPVPYYGLSLVFIKAVPPEEGYIAQPVHLYLGHHRRTLKMAGRHQDSPAWEGGASTPRHLRSAMRCDPVFAGQLHFWPLVRIPSGAVN